MRETGHRAFVGVSPSTSAGVDEAWTVFEKTCTITHTRKKSRFCIFK